MSDGSVRRKLLLVQVNDLNEAQREQVQNLLESIGLPSSIYLDDVLEEAYQGLFDSKPKLSEPSIPQLIEVRRNAIDAALREYDGEPQEAAIALGISPETIYRHLEQKRKVMDLVVSDSYRASET